MNIFRSVALVGVSTLLLSIWATTLHAGSYGSVHQQQAQQYQTQPRVIIVQPNRQISGQSSRIYGQQGQVQQYNYYPGLQQQPRHRQQRPEPYHYPGYGQQPRDDRYNNYGQPRDRWSQQRRDQYQRPDYRAQQQRYKAQRDYEREIRDRNMDRMLRNAKPFQYQQSPQRNQQHNYGSGFRR